MNVISSKEGLDSLLYYKEDLRSLAFVVTYFLVALRIGISDDDTVALPVRVMLYALMLTLAMSIAVLIHNAMHSPIF
jgi:hypothetical protein